MNSEESFLSQRIWIAFLIIQALNWSFLLLGSFVRDFLVLDALSGFTFSFAIRAILFLGIVPFVLKIPNGKRTLNEYLDDIKITEYRPLSKILIVSIGSAMLLLGGLILASLLYGSFTIDLNLIISPEAPLILLAINPGLWEEIMWRGIVLTLFLKKYSVRTSIAINTILFSLSHLINLMAGRDILMMLGQLIFVLIATPFLAYLFIKTNSLIPGILVHYSVDAFGILFYYSMLQPGPNFIVGGIFMLVGWFLGNVLAFGFLKFYLKKDSITLGDSNETKH